MLLVVGATRAKAAFPNVFVGTEKPERTVAALFTVNDVPIDPDK